MQFVQQYLKSIKNLADEQDIDFNIPNIIFELNGRLATANFLKFKDDYKSFDFEKNDIYRPVTDNYLSINQDDNVINYAQSHFIEHFEKIKFFPSDFWTNIQNNVILFNYLLDLIKTDDVLNYKKEIVSPIFDIKFLETNLRLEFMNIDDSDEFKFIGFSNLQDF